MMSDSDSSTSSSGNGGLDGNDKLSENTHESNPLLAESIRKWIAAIEKYLMETQATRFDLIFRTGDDDIQLGVEDLRSLFKILLDSHVTELSLDWIDLSGNIEDITQMLLKTKICTLHMTACSFSSEDILKLMVVLKDTCVTNLNITENDGEFGVEEGNKFLSYLVDSNFTDFRFDFGFSDPEGDPDTSLKFVTPFVRALPVTAITNLYLSEISDIENTLSPLFLNLHHTALTDLSLYDLQLKVETVQELSLYLRDSKLVSLDLSRVPIGDVGMDALAVGLVHSKITTLVVAETSLTGSNNLGLCLKDSKIKTLDVSQNGISSYILLSLPGFLRYSSLTTLDICSCKLGDKQGQKLMRSLQFSKINKLNVADNNLQLLTASEFADIVKDTEITDVNLSCNYFPFDGIVALGNCLKDSKLKSINLGRNQTSENVRTDPLAYSIFLEKTKESSLESIDLSYIGLHADGANTIASSLENTTFTCLNLGDNEIGNGVAHLAAQFKFTAITDLNFYDNKLGDVGAVSLAKFLNETKITDLNLAGNMLSDLGAKAVAKVLSEARLIKINLFFNSITNCGVSHLVKNSHLLEIGLGHNKIENDGYEALAKHVEGTFITYLDVRNNPATCMEGARRLQFIDTVLWENKTSVHHFLSFFKRIAPETSASNFRLDESVCNANVDVFLEECLGFYKTVVEQPSAISVIVNDKSFSFSWEEVVLLLREEFPRQFATFVINSLEATVTEYVVFLKRVEELELSKIVEFLLLNRPALMIDENEGILHPYVYKLLHKYKQPLYSSVEPEGKYKIIEYFSQHSELEGATEVINLMQN